jgi:hypothetical protein
MRHAWKEAEVAKDFFYGVANGTSFAKARRGFVWSYVYLILYLIAQCFQAVGLPP